jgi:trimethylamine--corrinoid protein Co-methyltransferase
MSTPRANPFIILYERPHSPLKYAQHSLEKLIFCTQKAVPVLYGSTASIGAASLVTFGDSFVMNMAEYFTALVLLQQVKKDATLVFGGGPTGLDMRTTVYSDSGPETMFSLSVRKQLAAHLGIPVFNAGGFSDAWIPDHQAALECATSLVYPALAGDNLIHDMGCLASGIPARDSLSGAESFRKRLECAGSPEESSAWWCRRQPFSRGSCGQYSWVSKRTSALH